MRHPIAWIVLGAMRFRCALGRSGRRAFKAEGDGATPIGRYRLRRVFYRADRLRRPLSGLPVRALRPQDGWCDAVGDRNYNRKITHPYPASAEEMWRSDGLYDIVVELDHNARPRKQGGGSAIFIHVARSGFQPTAGCVALKLRHLISILRHMKAGSEICIEPSRPRLRLTSHQSCGGRK